MKQFIIEVEKVNGYCSCGYQVGDQFVCRGLNTPDTPFCGGAYMGIFPMQTALHSGAQFTFEENPCSKTKLACADNGNVVFRITLLPKAEKTCKRKHDNVEKKEIATQGDLLTVLDLLDKTKIQYWLDGGWGVDVLAGRQTREHRDIDINFDARFTNQLLKLLKAQGYEIAQDLSPVRLELYHPKHGHIDIHPFILNEDGTVKQADPEGGFYEFETDIFGSTVFGGRTVPCISAKGQRLFHTGYELREVDQHDIKTLEALAE